MHIINIIQKLGGVVLFSEKEKRVVDVAVVLGRFEVQRAVINPRFLHILKKKPDLNDMQSAYPLSIVYK